MTPSEEVRIYEAGREARASMGALVLAVACVLPWLVLVWVVAS